LCGPCHSDPAVRALYPRLYRSDGDVTAEEVEAVFEAQLRELPAWWAAEAEREEREQRGMLGVRGAEPYEPKCRAYTDRRWNGRGYR